MVFVILGFGNKFLSHPSKILSYLSRSSFPIYILHLPINTFVGYFIIKTNLGLSLKFFLIVLLTTLVSFAAYEVIRRIDLLCFLLGIKTGNKLSPNKQVLSN
jgi:peptidoglycan/LPS O-acetylase OafA/YrhL